MLLKELSQPNYSVKKLNETLRRSYGRRVPTDIDFDRLESLLEQVNNDLQKLVIEGVTPQDSEYSRRLVIKHTAENMLQQRRKIQEASAAGDVLDRVCAKLVTCACDCINDGDDIEHAIHKVMDIYRSSRYRFPDSEVENRVRHGVDNTFGLASYAYDRDTLFDDQEMMFKERNKFLGARDTAIEAGEEEFEVGGEVYPVKEDYDDDVETITNAIYYRLRVAHQDEIKDFSSNDIREVVNNIAEFHAEGGLEELGSSDVSIMVNRVLRDLKDRESYRVEEKKKISAKDDPCWKGYKMVGNKKKGGKEVPNCVPGVKGESIIYEDAPPDMEDWVLDNKEEFKKRYGSKWEEVLYATAWKIHNEENGDK